ncbi:MAG: condensation domain-containing protein, partial [Senegalia sp. (in: firmicutes)]|uniref:condensation domain-containing protein n=1 Tax=Senegalia sp. (in: firmicutes) TaxID=1924098 RepID=UPI003F961740
MDKDQLNKNIEKIYSLSPLQEGMLYHQILDEKSGNYVVQTTLKINGNLSVDLAKESIQLLAKKHDVLRTLIPLNRFKKSVQIVLKEKEIEFKEFDFQVFSSEEQEIKIDEFLKKDVERGFDFEKSSNFRVAIIKSSYNEWIMVWSFHHIIIDGWCLSILFQDYLSYYFALKNGQSKKNIITSINNSKSYGLSYNEYIKWLEKQDKEQVYKYWEEFLDGYETDVKIDSFSDEKLNNNMISELSLSFSQSEYKLIKEKFVFYNVTLSTMIEAAWGLLLQTYSGSNDVVFGKVVSGRDISLPGIEEAVGLFINTIPTRVKINDDISCIELLNKIQSQGTQSLEYQHCSLANIQSRTFKGEFIHSVYAFENFLMNTEVLSEQEGLTFEIIKSREQTNYPLTLRVNQIGTLRLDILYNTNIYSEKDINMFLSQLKKIVIHFALNPDSLVSSMDIITDEEKSKITKVFNNPETTYNKNLNVKDIFEETVNKYPNKIAVVYEDEKISYDELNKKANQLAHKLLKLGVKKEEPVVILS